MEFFGVYAMLYAVCMWLVCRRGMGGGYERIAEIVTYSEREGTTSSLAKSPYSRTSNPCP